MKNTKSNSFVAALAVSLTGLSSLSAATVLFHGGTFSNGADQEVSSGGTVSIDSVFTYPGPYAPFPSDTLKYTPGGDYKNVGIDFYGNNDPVVQVGETTLSFSIYADTNLTNYMNGFTLNMETSGTPTNFNLATNTWRINGSPGAIGNFVGKQWNTLEFDLASVSGFVAGTTTLNGVVQWKNNVGTDTVYVGDIRLIPEPTSALLLGSAGFLGLLRRSRA